MSKIKDLEKQLTLLPDHVRNELTIVTMEDLGIPYTLRIDEKLPREFIPRMPESAASSEDSTVPRVVTAHTLLGCITGAATVLWHILSRNIGDPGNNLYKISGFEFDYGLKPTKKLVYDADSSHELWHTTYDKETIAYPFFNVGEVFFHKVTTTVLGNNSVNGTEVEFLVNVVDERGIRLSNGINLKKGYYYIKGNFSRYALGKYEKGVKVPKRLSYDEDDAFEVNEVSAEVYKSFRVISVTKKG